MNYYPFHLGDYSAHTAHLDPIEDIAYRRLLDLYYLREAPLPMSDDLPRLIRMRDHAEVVARILAEFFEEDEDTWTHQRCDAELARMQEKQAKARASAAASVSARAAKAEQTRSERSTDVQRPLNEGSTTNTNTNTNTNTPLTPRKRGAAAGRFEEFWTAWPRNERKQDKAKCADHWRRNGLDALADAILSDVRVKRGTQKWAEGFIEAPLVYLRGRRWQDGVVPATNEDGLGLGDWRTTRSGIEAKGQELGLGRWDEQAFQTGRGEHFQKYRQRVEAAAEQKEAA